MHLPQTLVIQLLALFQQYIVKQCTPNHFNHYLLDIIPENL